MFRVVGFCSTKRLKIAEVTSMDIPEYIYLIFSMLQHYIKNTYCFFFIINHVWFVL